MGDAVVDFFHCRNSNKKWNSNFVLYSPTKDVLAEVKVVAFVDIVLC